MNGTWLRHSDLLSEHLAYAVGMSGPTHPDDLDLALHARTAVLDLAAAVHRDVSGLRSTGRPRVDDAGRYVHPVAHLGQLLDRHRPPAARQSPLQALSAPPHDRIGRQWAKVARDAALARHEWDRLDDDDRRLAGAAWTAMHLVAQHVAAVTWMDEDLVPSCQQAGRTTEAVLLREASSSLRPVAVAVASLAASGPLEQLPDLTAPAPRRALAVRQVDHVPTGLERLAELLRSSDHVNPEHVQAGFRLLSHVVRHAGAVLVSDSPLRISGTSGERARDVSPALLGALVDYADGLQRAGRQPGRVRTLLPDDALIPMQCQQIAAVFRGAYAEKGRRAGTATPGAAVDVAGKILAATLPATRALRVATDSALEDGKWLVPAGEKAPFRLSWVPSGPRHVILDGLDTPTLVKSASLAGERAAHVGNLLPASAWQRARTLPAVGAVIRPRGDLLAAALRDAERRAAPLPSRPSSVSRPPALP